jgi:hypothetical protein
MPPETAISESCLDIVPFHEIFFGWEIAFERFTNLKPLVSAREKTFLSKSFRSGNLNSYTQP